MTESRASLVQIPNELLGNIYTFTNIPKTITTTSFVCKTLKQQNQTPTISKLRQIVIEDEKVTDASTIGLYDELVGFPGYRTYEEAYKNYDVSDDPERFGCIDEYGKSYTVFPSLIYLDHFTGGRAAFRVDDDQLKLLKNPMLCYRVINNDTFRKILGNQHPREVKETPEKTLLDKMIGGLAAGIASLLTVVVTTPFIMALGVLAFIKYALDYIALRLDDYFDDTNNNPRWRRDVPAFPVRPSALLTTPFAMIGAVIGSVCSGYKNGLSFSVLKHCMLESINTIRSVSYFNPFFVFQRAKDAFSTHLTKLTVKDLALVVQKTEMEQKSPQVQESLRTPLLVESAMQERPNLSTRFFKKPKTSPSSKEIEYTSAIDYWFRRY